MYKIKECELLFDWDEKKNNTNKSKHGISFEEAITVFQDICGVVFDDPDHSDDEERFLIVGTSDNSRILIVSHCCRLSETCIRIISARKATTSEVKTYLEFNGITIL